FLAALVHHDAHAAVVVSFLAMRFMVVVALVIVVAFILVVFMSGDAIGRREQAGAGAEEAVAADPRGTQGAAGGAQRAIGKHAGFVGGRRFAFLGEMPCAFGETRDIDVAGFAA